MRCHLIAVQARMRPEHYASADRFRREIVRLASRAVEGLDGAAKVIAFPELIGLPLLFALDEPRAAAGGSAARALLERAFRDRRALLRAALRGRRFGPGALYLPQAPVAYGAYVSAFSEAARISGATLIAGSIFLPRVEREALRGVHVSDSRVHNVAFTFAQNGTILGRSPKVHLTPGRERRAGLSAAPLEALTVLHSAVGPIGVAVCLDAFYPSVIERYDAAGAWLLVQPSANNASWTRSWPGDPGLSEGEAWLRHGLRAGIQNRTNLRFGLNPMLVGDLLDLHPRGRSSIVVDVRLRPDARVEGWPGLLAIAASSDGEEIVRAEVEID